MAIRPARLRRGQPASGREFVEHAGPGRGGWTRVSRANPTRPTKGETPSIRIAKELQAERSPPLLYDRASIGGRLTIPCKRLRKGSGWEEMCGLTGMGCVPGREPGRGSPQLEYID